MDQAINVLKEVASKKSVTSNEFDAFGQHVSSQLMCLPLQEAIMLQEDIQKLITTVRLRCLKNGNLINTSVDRETRTTSSAGLYLQDNTEPSTSSGGNEQYHELQVPKALQKRNLNIHSYCHETQDTTCSGSDLQDNINPSTSSGANKGYQFQQGQKTIVNYFQNWTESDNVCIDYD